MPPAALAIITGLPAARSSKQAQIQLAGDLQAFLDEHASDDAPLGAGLVRDQGHAENLLGERFGLVGRLGELDAAALAAPAGVNLRLDDDDARSQAVGDVSRLGDVEGDFPAGHGHAVAGEDGFGLIFVNFHRGSRKRSRLEEQQMLAVIARARQGTVQSA